MKYPIGIQNFETLRRDGARGANRLCSHLLVLLILTFSSCSGEQQIPAPAVEVLSPIAFSASQQKEQVTRAGSTTPLEAYTNSFRVWAYKHMSNVETQTVMNEYHVDWIENSIATSTTNTDGWEYILLGYPDQSIKFWDFNAAAYRFFGVAEIGTPGTWDKTQSGVYKYTCVADATNVGDAPFYTRLWYSTGDESIYPNRKFGEPVTLEFVRPFAEVQFRFIYSDPAATPLPMLEEPDFRPNTAGQRIATLGTVTITFPITGGTEEDWSSERDNAKYLLSLTKKENWYSVLPIKGQGDYIFRVTVNGDDKTCIVPAQYMIWEPGYRYTYIFKVNDEGGLELDNVEVGIKNWEKGKDGSHLIYNW